MILWLVLIGLFSGVVGGMGMGGGTVLVPLLSLVGLEQITVQGINLVSFVPMCCVALLVHGKGGRISTRHIWYILVPALLSAVVGVYVAHHIQGDILRIMYGIMLLIVGVWQLIVSIVAKPTTRQGYKVLYCPSGVLRAKYPKGRQ